MVVTCYLGSHECTSTKYHTEGDSDMFDLYQCWLVHRKASVKILQAFILRDNFLGDTAGGHACTMLKFNTTLVNLDLSGNVMLQRTL